MRRSSRMPRGPSRPVFAQVGPGPDGCRTSVRGSAWWSEWLGVSVRESIKAQGSGGVRAGIRASAHRLRVLPAVRGLAPGVSRRACLRAGHGRPRAHRPGHPRGLGGDALRLETVWHGRQGTGPGPGSLRLAARMVGFAAEQRVRPVLSNAVLDAARFYRPRRPPARAGLRRGLAQGRGRHAGRRRTDRRGGGLPTRHHAPAARTGAGHRRRLPRRPRGRPRHRRRALPRTASRRRGPAPRTACTRRWASSVPGSV